MNTLRDVYLLLLKETFHKIRSDFESYEKYISKYKKSDLREPFEYQGFYGTWNHFYLHEDFKNRNLQTIMTGRPRFSKILTKDLVDQPSPIFSQMIEKMLIAKKAFEQLTPDNFTINKHEDDESPKLNKNQIDCSVLPAIIHDLISSAQNNATISQLLEDFLLNSNSSSLIKAVSVDASVTKIPEIQEKIHSLVTSEQIAVEEQLVKAKKKPPYSPNRNNQTTIASIFIYQFDTVGLFDPAFGYSDTNIYELALTNDAISLDFDESTFLKKLRDYKKMKSQGRTQPSILPV